MAINVIEDLKTTRSYPRLMKCSKTNRVILWDHLGNQGMVLSGDGVGRVVAAASTDFDSLFDFKGSVTIHNKD